MKAPSPTTSRPPLTTAERAILYLRETPGAVSGESGHNQLLFVACQLRHGFAMTEGEAIALIKNHYNDKCVPPWKDHEILHKVQDADKLDNHEKPKGHLIGWTEGDAREASPLENEPGDSKQYEPKPEKESKLQSGRQILDEAMLRIMNRESEIVFDCGYDLGGFEIGPGKLTIIGAPPGTGKTSLASQIGFAALQNHPKLQLVIANAEMDASTLVRREVARTAQVGYQKVRFATFDDAEEARLFDAGKTLAPLLGRTQFMGPPFTSELLIESLDDEPGLLVVDYLQKFRGGTDALEGLETVMNHLRWIALHDWAVLALSSTARMQGKGGKHDHSQMDMGSFRGSGEIEFQADAAYVLRDESGGATGDRAMKLDCVKNRHGTRDAIDLVFKSSQMRFDGTNTPQRETQFDEYNNGDF